MYMKTESVYLHCKLYMHYIDYRSIEIIASHVSRIVSTREPPNPTSYLLPASTEFCLSDLCVVPSLVLIPMMSPVCLSFLCSLTFVYSSVGLLYCITSWHRFVHVFSPKRDAPQDSTRHDGHRRGLNLHQKAITKTWAPHVCCLLSPLLCGVIFLFLTKSEKRRPAFYWGKLTSVTPNHESTHFPFKVRWTYLCLCVDCFFTVL